MGNTCCPLCLNLEIQAKSKGEVVMKRVKVLCVVMVITLLVTGYTFAGTAETETMTQKVCPVMTFGAVGCSVTKHDIFIDYRGKRIYFCSRKCRETFKKNP